MRDGGTSILVADDERGLRELYHYTLEPIGFEVVTVSNGQAAVDALRERAFDLVILDVHMPVMGGPEALAHIRRLRPEQRVLVVSSSSDVTRASEARVEREYGVECIYKPMTLDELMAAIERALGAGGEGGDPS